MKNLYSLVFKMLIIGFLILVLSFKLFAQGNALQFNGTNQYVQTTNPTYPGANFTIEAWIKTTSSTGIHEITGWGNTSVNNHCLEFRVNAGKLEFILNKNGGQSFVGNISVSTGKWTHVAAIKSGNTVSLYVNGVLDNSNGSITNGVLTTNRLTIGELFYNNAFSSLLFQGSIDEVRVYNVALTPTELNQRRFVPLIGNETGLLAYYNFDSSTGTVLADQKGTNNGTLINGPTWTESYAMVVPANTTTTNIEDKSFTANWETPATGTVDKYLLDVSISSTFASFVTGYNAKDCGLNLLQEVTGLTRNTTYYWRVRAEKASVAGTGGDYNSSNTLTTPKMSGTYTIDPAGSGDRNFTTIAAAVSVLNSVGISGPVTFRVKDDATFNEAAELSLTATGTAANTITFIRSGDGTNKPIINVPAVGSSPFEMMYCSGSDYVIFNGLDFRATSANTTCGIAFSANGTDGCHDNLIQNCNIQLNATNTTQIGYGVQFLFNSATSNLNNNNKVNNNTISNVNQGIRFAGSGGGYDSGNEANGNSITNLGNTGTTQVIYGINIDYQLNAKVANNLIQFNPASQVNNLDVVGIRSGSGANNTLEINGNTIKDANIAQGNNTEFLRGIYIAAGSTSSIHDNTIQNFAQTSANGCEIWGIKIETGNSNVYNNVIKDMTNASTSTSSRIVGMETLAGTANNFYNNKVFNLTSTGSGTNASIEGLRIHTGSSNANIYNNMFYNLKCANGSASPTVTGILLVSGNCNVYNNTVYIDNNSGTSGNISTALFTSTAGTIDLRNNIFVSKGTNSNGAWNIALFRSNTAFNLSAASNNNLYYAGTPGANNKIYHTATSGTPSANTLLDFQAAVTPKENASVTESATPFANIASPYDLHIQTGIATLLESHGLPITTPVNITTDIDGNTRNASTPDLGADEGDFTQTPYITAEQNNVTATSRGLTNQEVIAVVINTSTTPLATSFTFNTTGSTNATTDIANARLWYTGATGTFATTTQVGSAIANPNGTFTMTGSQALTAGDNYFWLTYDVADGATLNNVLDAQCTSVTAAGLAVTPQLTTPTGSRSINGLLSGTYTIDPAGSGARNFTTFTAAVTALNVGIAGPVTFLVKDDATFNEVATRTISTTGTAANTITFQRSGDGANKPKILFTGTSSVDACLRLNSCDYVTFDGLEIQANGTSASNFVEWGFYLIGEATNGCQHNTIKNCDISFATANTTSTHGIYLASVATNAAGANSYNTFVNNTILRPARGYYIIGATGSYDVNNKVSTENSGASSISEIGYNNHATSTFGVEYQYQTNLEFANTAISFKSASAVTSAADHIEGIYSRNGNNTASLHHNSITGLKVNKSATDLSVMGILLESNASAEIYNNTIQTIDNQNTNSQSVWAIKVAAGVCNIYNNVISDIKNNSTATSSGRVVGIESAGTTAKIYNNTISNLNYVNSQSNVDWGNVVGILAFDGTTATIYNNMLFNLKAANSVAHAVTGIRFSCTTVNLYNNTVYLDYTSTNASNSSACVWQKDAGTTLDMRNNIFINKSVMTTGTRAVAFWKDAGTLSATTNNNLYYAGTPGTKNLIYYNGTTGYQTLLDYQAVVSPKDNKAVTEAATPFVSAVSPYDLHIKTDVATLLESHGIPITSPVTITADMDGDVRNATTPDLGADEGNFTQTPYIVATQSNVTETSRGLTNQQVIAVVINTNTTPSATSFTFNTTGSTNATTDIANAKLWHTGDSGTFSTTTQVGSTVANPNGTFTVTGSQALTAGDNYFWLTYDVADGATVNNVLDAQCTSVTVGGTAVTPQLTTPTGTRKINGLLSGIYTIDAAGSGPRNFTTFTAAVTALNVGIAGPVTFNVADGATFTASALNITTTGTAVNTITFKQSGTGTKPVLNITSSTHLIKVNSGDYFTFDGLNIVNSSGSATYGLHFAGAATDGCQYNTIQNCVVTMNSANTSDCWSVWLSSAATSALGANSNNHVYNNTFNNGSQIVRFTGISAYYDSNNEFGGNKLVNVGNTNTETAVIGFGATYQTNLKIFDNDIQFRNNTFSVANEIMGVSVSTGSNNTVEIYGNKIYGMNSSLPGALLHTGIRITAAATASVHNNTIHGLTQNTVNGSDLVGIYITQGDVDIYENEIYNLTNKSTASASGCYGIQFTGGSANVYGNKIYGIASLGTGSSANAYGIFAFTGTVSANISNNMVYNVKAPNTSWSYSTVGIALYTGTINVYNNTVYLDYTSTVAGNSSAAIYSSTTGNIDLRNNIFINKSNMATGTRAVAFWKGTTASILSSTSNNNLYYAGTPDSKHLIYYASDKSCQALSDYKTFVTPRENNSVTEAATPFVSAVSPYDLHIDATQTTVASNAGTVIGSGATDMEGDTRNVLTPDIGADEFWAPQTITFDAITAKTYGDADFTLPLNASSGLPITYASDNSTVATVSGNTVHIVGAGTCNITANQAGDASYYPAPEVSRALTVNKADPTITLDNITLNYGNAAYNLAASSNSTGGITYTSSIVAVATISGSVATIVRAGTTTITVTQATDDNYKSGTTTATLTVNKIAPVITMSDITKDFGQAEFLVSATSTSTGDFTYTSSEPDVATINGNMVTIVGAGNSAITISQEADVNYLAGTATALLTVNKIDPTITLAYMTKDFGEVPFNVSATSNSTGAITYSSSDENVATVAGSTITIVGAGETTITATQATDTNYKPGTATATLTVNTNAPTITLGNITKNYGDPYFTINATSASAGALTYSSSDEDVATITGNIVTIVGGGTATITVTQAADGDYAEGTTTATLTVNKIPQVVTFGVLGNKTYSDAPFTLSATASSGLDVSYTSNNTSVATVSGSEITIVGAGSVTITATQAGNANYSEALPVTHGFTVFQASQSITFNAIGNKIYGNAPFELAASSSSGLALSYSSSNTSVATVSGSTVTINGAGSTIIIATQAGNANFTPATLAFQLLTVERAPQTITFDALADKTYSNAPFTLSATASSNLAVTYTTDNSSVATVSGNTVILVGAGTANITASQAGSANYDAATQVTRTLTVHKQAQTITFDALAGKTYGESPFTVSATGGASGNPVTFTSSNDLIATCTGTNGSTITLIGSGSCNIYANQAGNVNHSAAGQVTQPLTVGASGQTITFDDLTDKTYGDAPFTLTATASSGLPVSYMSTNTAVATVSGNTVTIVGAGTTGIIASQSGNGNYNGATDVEQSLTVAKANQILTLNPFADAVPLKNFTTIPVTASSSSGLTVVISLGSGSAATLIGSNLENIGETGNVVVKVDQAGDDNYNAASISHSFDVVKSNQTITFDALANQVYSTGLTLGLSSTASSGLTVSYTVVSGPATLTGSTLNISGAGVVVVTATQAGDGTCNPASDVTQSLTVEKAPQSITFEALTDKTYSDAPFTLTATASSGLPVGYASSNTAVATVSGNTVTIVGAGTANITASQAGNANYSAATEVVQGLIVGKQTQAITFEALDAQTYGYAPYTVSATGGASGNPVTFTSSNNSIATCTGSNGSTITVIGAGSCTIYANQAGNTNYSAASQADQLLTVGKQTQAITFDVLAAKTFGDAPFTLSATASSGLAVTYATDNSSVATVSGNTVTIVGTGTANIIASQAGNTNYDAATQATRALTVNKQAQTIIFEALAAKTYGDAPFTVLAPGGASGNPVIFTSSNNSVATCTGADGSTITVVGAGSCTIYANQAGNANYSIAPSVGQLLTVGKPTQAIIFDVLAAKTYGDAPFTVSATGGASGNPVTFTSSNSSIATCTGADGSTITVVGAGSCTIYANQAGNVNYIAAEQVGQLLTVGKSTQSITFEALAGKTYSDAPFTLTGTATSGLPVSFISSNTAVATVLGTQVTIVGAGTTTITAHQAGNVNYNGATSVAQSLTVSKANQILTLNPLPVDAVALKDFTSAIQVTATSSSGLSVAISLGAGSAAILNGSNQLESIGATGNVVVKVDQAGNNNYNPASISHSFDVVKSNQSITFNALANQVYSSGLTLGLSASASSGLAVSYMVVSGPATLSGNTLNISGVGEAVIKSSQAGNETWNPATDVTRTLTVGKASQSITFDALATKTYGEASFTLTATASSTLPVSYASSNTAVATISGSQITIVGAGTTNITANQAGNANYSAATEVVRGLIVGKQTQAITFESLADKTYSNAPFTVSATGGASGNPVTFTSSNNSIATCTGTNGSTITVIGTGSCTIYANQSGNTNYDPASQVGQLLTVGKQTQAIIFEALDAQTYGDTPYTVSATGGASGNPVTFTSSNDLVATCTGTNGSTITLIGSGSCTIYANQAGNVNYSAAGQVTQPLTVGASGQTITFDDLTDKTYGDAPFTLTATASSGLPVSYISTNPAVATVLGNEVTIVGAGTTGIIASQSGNVNFNGATDVEQSLTVAKANQALTLNPLPVGAVSIVDFPSTIQVTASSSSGQPVVISLGAGSAANLNGSNQLVSIGAAGYVVVKVDQAGNDNYNAASISHSFDVIKSNQSITFAALANQVYSSDLTLGLSASASSGLSVSYAVVSGPATLSGNTLNISGAGEVIITASQAGNEAWNPATDVTRSLTVAEASQSITFVALTDKTYSDAPFTLTATASSTLPVSYASSNTAVATVSGTQVTIVGAGTTNITASQAGNANYGAATEVVQGLIVGKQTQAITFEALDAQTYGNAPYSILATGGASGNPVTFTSSNNSIATCTGTNGSTITIVGSGSCTIYANQAGNVNYSAATEVERGLNVGVTSQSITFGVLAAKTYGDSPFTLSATASSGLAVSYTSDNTDVATVSGNTVILVGAGDANIIATQAGNANYDAATQVTRALTVSKQAQSIIFETLDSKIYGDTPFTVSATGGTSGNPVTFTSSNDLVATCTGTNGSTITIIGGGSCTIYANQAGNVNYSAAGQVGQLLTVGKPTQSITFDVLAAKTYGDASFTLVATASSGLAVSYTSGNTDVATISGNTVILVGAGVANIIARQAGNANYSAAPQVTRVLTVNKQAQTINFDPLATKTIGDTPFTVSATGGTSGNPVTFTSSKNSVATCTGTNGSTITIIGAGSCTIYANQAGNANYSAAQQVGRSLIVHIYIAGDTNHDGTITSPEIAGDTDGDGQITSPEIAGDTDGDGMIGGTEITGDKDGDGAIDGTEITGDKDGDGTIDGTEISGDKDGDGTIDNTEITGDKDGDGTIDGTEITGDKDGDGTIDGTEITGDKDGDGTIDGTEITGDKDGDSTIDGTEITGDKDGDSTIDGTEITGDKDGDGTIDGTEITGDKDGNGTIGGTEITGDKDGDGTIDGTEITGDKDGDGTIDGTEITGDKDGDSTIDGTEITGDKDGDGTIDGTEITGDKDGDGTIDGTEITGDKDGDGTIDGTEITGDKDGNGTIGGTEITGDKDGDGTIDGTEITGDKDGDGTIDGTEITGDKDGDGTIDGTEITGDKDGDGTIDGTEITGDKDGDSTIDGTEITGDKDGDGTIGTGEIAGDKDGNGTIGNSETAGDINGDDTIGTGETAGDNNGDGNIGSGETAGDTNGDGTIGSGEITGDKDGDGTIGTGEIIGDSDGNGTVDDDEIITSDQIIIFDLLNAKTYGNAPFTLSGIASSGLTVRYTSSNPAVVTVSGNTVTIVGAGVSNITASQDGNSSYNAAVDVIRGLTVNKASQNIVFEALTAKTNLDAPFTVSATGGISGNAVIFTSSDNSIATCSGTNGSTITVIGAGSCTIYANQAGNNNYEAAPQVGQLLTVHKYIAGDVNHDGVITSPEIAGDSNGDGSIGSGEVTGDIDGDGTIDGTEVKGDSNGDGTADTTIISGDNNGDGKIDGGEITGDSNGDGKIDNGEIAGDTNGDGTIGGPEVAGDTNGDGKIDGTEVNGDTNGDGQVTESETTQTIIFLPLVGKNLGDEPFTVSAAGGSSGNPVTFTSSNIAVATCSGINGQIITIVGVGTCTITAHQTGNSIFSAADNVSQVLKVDLKTGLEDNPIENQLTAYAIRNIEIRIKGEVSRGAVATLYDMNGRSVKVETLEEGILNVMPTPGVKTGIYILSVNDHGKIQTFKIMLRE